MNEQKLVELAREIEDTANSYYNESNPDVPRILDEIVMSSRAMIDMLQEKLHFSLRDATGRLTQKEAEEFEKIISTTKPYEFPKDYVAPKEISSKEFLERIKEELPTMGNFTPYAYYNESMDEIQVYFKDESNYTKPVNDELELYLSYDNDVIGVKVLGVEKLIQDKGKFK